MTTPPEDITQKLIDAGIGSDTPGHPWRIFTGYMQEAPDQAICVYETPGPAPDETSAVEYPDFQIKVRGAPNGYAAAREKWQAIYDLLHGGDLGTGWVYFFAKGSGPITMGQDENRRPMLGMNFRSMKASP